MGAGDFLNNALGSAQKDAQDGLKKASDAAASGEKSAQQAEQEAAAAEKKAQQEVQQAQQQLAQAEQKAKQEVQQAQQQVQQAEQKLAAAEKQAQQAQANAENQAQQLEKSAENAANQAVQQAQQELQQAKQQLANAEKQGQQAQADAEKKLADAEKQTQQAIAQADQQAQQLAQQLESKVQQTVQQLTNEVQTLRNQAQQAMQGAQQQAPQDTQNLLQKVADTLKGGLAQAAANAVATFAKLQQTFSSPDPVNATSVACQNKSVLSLAMSVQQTRQTESFTMQQINTLKAQFPQEVDSKSTFTPVGVSKSDAVKFLRTPDGQNYLNQLRAASPRGVDEKPADYAQKIVGRALQQVMSGSQIPKALPNINQPLLKIVPKGQAVKSYTPYFVTAAELKKAFDSGQPLGALLGLPLASQAEEYDVYQVMPKDPANLPTVYQSAVAPTSELLGRFTTPGGAGQTLVPNPGAFTEPQKIAGIPGVKPGKK